MADFKCHDGREIDFDLWKVTRAEFKAFFDRSKSAEQDDIVIARACGLTVEELNGLAQPDYAALVTALVGLLSKGRPTADATLSNPR